MGGMALWITGLPGSGKSTIASLLKERHPDFVVLNMDELRQTVTPEPSYSDQEREIVYRSLVFFARKLAELGHPVIIDATGNRRRWRDLARQLVPGYAEIYLKCSLEECMKRERQRFETHGAPDDIYEKGESGWPVPGMSAPYEEPLSPEVLVESDTQTAEQAVSLIEKFLGFG